MRLLWIGEYTNQILMNSLIDYGYCPMSITIAQNNITEGLEKQGQLDSISGCRLPFRGLQRTRFKGQKWSDQRGGFHHFVDLVTLPYFEQIYKTNQMVRAATIWAKQHNNESCRVIVYGMHTPYLSCIQALRKAIPDIKITCIVPDLPEYYDFNPSRFKKMMKKIDLHILYRKVKLCDRFVLFAESMRERLNLKTDQYIIMEGCIRLSNVPSELKPKSEFDAKSKKILLYSGCMNHGYGIDKLLEAFSKIIDSSYRLVLIGSGSYTPYIEQAAKKDKRICFLGYLQNQQKLHEYQRSATVLLCMIPPENPATEYCFPSKLFEYMVSGNPTMAFRLKGIGCEYYNYIIPFDDESPQGLARSIQKVAELPEDERDRIGRSSRAFVMGKKNNLIQAERIYKYATSK